MTYSPIPSNDAAIFQANQTDMDTTDDDTEDPNDVRAKHDMHAKSKFDYPRHTEECASPPPTRPVLRAPADPKRLNGKRLTRATLARDRDLLEY